MRRTCCRSLGGLVCAIRYVLGVLCGASADREEGNAAFSIGGLGALVEAGIENEVELHL